MFLWYYNVMKKKIVIVLSFLFLITIGFTFLQCDSVSALSILDSNIEYISIHKDIDISEEKVCKIEETIVLRYKQSGINLGISRHISKVNTVTRVVDGKEYQNTTFANLQLNGVTLDGEEEYAFLEDDGEFYYINTGADGDYKEAGEHTYVISYTYNLGHDFINAFDDFTFDIMDYDYLTNVESFSAEITLPKDFDISQISFRTNEMQPISNEAVNLNVVGNTISCSFENLSAQNGLTIQVILPNGYFNTSYTPNALYFVTFGLCFVALVAIIILYIINRKKNLGIVTVEFYPPKDFSPINVARYYRGTIKSKDFASLIIYWASLGYLKIKFENDKNIVLIKTKDMGEEYKSNKISKETEIAYFNEIFKNGDTVALKDKKLKSSSALQKMAGELYTPLKQDKSLKIWRAIVQILAVLPLAFFILWKGLIFSEYFTSFFVLLFPTIAMLVFNYIPMPIVFKCFWCGIFGGVTLAILILTGITIYDTFGLLYIAVVVFILGGLFGRFFRAYTKEQLETRVKIIGFKNFLVTAELDRLKMLVDENPEYFYSILPFCYVLNITRKMEKKFKALNMPYPDYCPDGNYAHFCFMMSLSVANISRTPASKGSSGGGRSGGGRRGSSGGGAGGGGSRGR